MRIGLVVDDGIDNAGGVQQYVTVLGGWLERQGHVVRYLCGETHNAKANIYSLSKNVGVSFNKNRLTIPLPASKSSIQTILTNEAFDVLHVQLPCSPWLAGRVVRQADPATAVVGTFHVAPHSTTVAYAARAFGLVLKPLIRRFDDVVSVSPAAQDFARKMLGIETAIVPNTVDLKHMRGTATHKTDQVSTIVYLGRLVPRKGCRHLLAAINILVRDYHLKVRVIFAGKGPMERELKEYVHTQGLEDYVTFTGFVPEDDKADLLASADLAVFPSTGGESFGIVLIEAMAAGAGAVLGGDNSGYNWVLGGMTEALFDPTNEKALAAKLLEFLESDEKRRELHKKQAQQVKKFDIETVGNQMLERYQRAIAKRSNKKHNKA